MEESQEKTTEKAGWHEDNVKEYSKEVIPVPVPVKIIFFKVRFILISKPTQAPR